MTSRPAASLISIFVTGLLFSSHCVYAEHDLSLIQEQNLLVNDSLTPNSTDSSMSDKLQNMFFEKVLDNHLIYNLGANHTSLTKTQSSVGLKLRSEITYLQFNLSF